MERGQKTLSQEEILMREIQNMNSQIQWIQKQKDKVLRSFCQLGLQDTIVAFELMFEEYQKQLDSQIQLAGGDPLKIVEAYQKYIKLASESLVSTVSSFKEFGKTVQNDFSDSDHHRTR